MFFMITQYTSMSVKKPEQQLQNLCLNPFGEKHEECTLIKQFWLWLYSQSPSDMFKKAIDASKIICNNEAWKVNDLKHLSDLNSAIYKHVISKQLPNDVAYSMWERITVFKQTLADSWEPNNKNNNSLLAEV